MLTLQHAQKKLVKSIKSVNQIDLKDWTSFCSFSDAASWEFLSGSEWQTDSTVSFECIEVKFQRISDAIPIYVCNDVYVWQAADCLKFQKNFQCNTNMWLQ